MKTKAEIKNFVLDRIKKNHGIAMVWDWKEEIEFADFIGDEKSRELFELLLRSNAIHTKMCAVYLYSPETKRITKRRREMLNELVKDGKLKKRWVGVGQGGQFYTGAKRFMGYFLQGYDK